MQTTFTAEQLADPLTAPEAARMGEAGRAQVTEHFNLRCEATRLSRLVTWALTGGARPARRPELGHSAEKAATPILDVAPSLPPSGTAEPRCSDVS